MSYQCPLCLESLSLNERSYRCLNNHQFDCAKEGYVNLLPVQFKHSKEPGDSREMMHARREFLDSGHYLPLRDRIIQLITDTLGKSISSSQVKNILDIGCGEGYYTGALAKALQPQNIQTFGLDVAKIAIKNGAKRYSDVNFCVASSHRLPFTDNSIDAVLRIYAPCKDEELDRVITDNGFIVTVTPGPRHLYQLKELIYQDVHLHANKDEIFSGFKLATEITLGYSMELKGIDAWALLSMTPFAWKMTEENKAKLKQKISFNCETDFIIRLYQREPL